VKRTKAVLIVGGSGFLGTHLAMALRDGYKVYGTYFHKKVIIPGVATVPFHVADRNWAKRVAYNIQPDVVIYAAGNDDVDAVELDVKTGDQVHTRGCAGILGVTDIFQPKFILISNPYVFDGTRGNYRETDTIVPQTALGKYKVSAENYLRGHSLNHVIVRSSPVFGRGNGQSITFTDRLRKALSKGEALQVKSDELHSFAPVQGLVETIVRAVETGVKNRVLHYGGLTKVTHLQYAQAFAKRFGYDPKLLSALGPGAANKDGVQMDYSLNSSQTLLQLKLNAFELEEGLKLLG
jgi:dTDP-4-dehydrorhamnose reductase